MASKIFQPFLTTVNLPFDSQEVNPSETFRYAQKVNPYTNFALKFFFSQPIAEFVSSAIDYTLAVRCEKNLNNLPEGQRQKIESVAQEKSLADVKTIKETAKKKMIASAIRLGVIAATILATIGLTVAGIAAGLALGSPIVAGILGGVGLLAPSITVFCLDTKSGFGAADLAFTAGTYFSAITLNIVGLIVGVASRLLTTMADSSEHLWKPTWVDHNAEKLVTA